MRRLLAAMLILVAAESAALACSCMPLPQSAEQRRTLLREIGRGAVALVEVEQVTPYRGAGQGELLRVRRTLAGRAPARFRVERDGPPSSAGCDVEFDSGGRGLLLLYPARQPGNARDRVYRINSLCVAILIGDPAFRAALIRDWPRR